MRSRDWVCAEEVRNWGLLRGWRDGFDWDWKEDIWVGVELLLLL